MWTLNQVWHNKKILSFVFRSFRSDLFINLILITTFVCQKSKAGEVLSITKVFPGASAVLVRPDWFAGSLTGAAEWIYSCFLHRRQESLGCTGRARRCSPQDSVNVRGAKSPSVTRLLSADRGAEVSSHMSQKHLDDVVWSTWPRVWSRLWIWGEQPSPPKINPEPLSPTPKINK